MTDAPPRPELPDIPEAVAAPKSKRSLPLVWLIPLLAALVGGWLAVKSILDKGPVITITFATAEGLEAGKTKLRYKDVEMGLVTGVALAPDTSYVVVTAELVKEAKRYLVQDTRFWVVRPRISGGTVTGLGTLLSGSYIGVDIGQSTKAQDKFVGLEVPPVFSTSEGGRVFVLHSDNAGSIDAGSPVFFRRLQVGQVAGEELDKDGKGVTIKVFVNSPYDRFVNDNTRFWHASGIDVTLDSSGVKIDTQSVVSIMIGGLAFETPAEWTDLPPASQSTEFRLFANRTEALRNPETDVMKLAMVFRESVRGLSPGAAVDFRGIGVGTVTSITPEVDTVGHTLNIKVEADLFPRRMRPRSAARAVLTNDQRRDLIHGMVARGLRAQLRTGNLLTGQLFIALDFFPGAAKVSTQGAALLAHDDLPEIPTSLSGLAELQSMLASIGRKIDSIPFEQIGRKIEQFPFEQIGTDVHTALQSATRMMDKVDAELTPEARAALADVRKAVASADQALKPNSPLSDDARNAMRELARAAAAIRVLADYLERHPESLIRGKREEPKEDGK